MAYTDESEVDFAKLSDPEMLEACGDNARMWASAFCHFNPEVNFDMMVTWFANAIETSWDCRNRKLSR